MTNNTETRTALRATTQKSYYGKATVIYRDGEAILQSYETEVCKIDKNGDFRKLWNGYSRTTAKHVNDFRKLFGLNPIAKKQWDNIESEGGSKERYVVEFSNGFVSWTSGTVFENYYEAMDFAENVVAQRNYMMCYSIEEI